MMSVSDETRNNRRASDLAIRVYASETPTSFTLREDDGESFAYRGGRVATTVLAQQLVGETARIDLGAATGSYAGMASERPVRLELGVLFGHLENVLHDLAYRELIIDQARLLTLKAAWASSTKGTTAKPT